jgi:hypothetical protein
VRRCLRGSGYLESQGSPRRGSEGPQKREARGHWVRRQIGVSGGEDELKLETRWVEEAEALLGPGPDGATHA